jgi:hypothetical protein
MIILPGGLPLAAWSPAVVSCPDSIPLGGRPVVTRRGLSMPAGRPRPCPAALSCGIHTELTSNMCTARRPASDDEAWHLRMRPTVGCADVDEQELPGGAEPLGPPADGATAPLPPAETGQRPGRGGAARRALTSRAAGWVVAAVLAGVVIGLLIGLTRPAPTVAVSGVARQFTIGPAGLPPAAFGPFGPARRIAVFCGAGVPMRSVIISGSLPGRSISISPPGQRPVRQLVPPGAVRWYLPNVPPIVGWEYVRGLPAKLPAGAPVRVQLPMVHCRAGMMAGVPAQVIAPPVQPTSQATP